MITVGLEEKEAKFAILKVAYLLTAVDGEITEDEIDVFNRLGERCKAVDPYLAQTIAVEARKAAYRLVDMSERVFACCYGSIRSPEIEKISPETTRLEFFFEEVKRICDWDRFAENLNHVHEAFAVWVEIVMADRKCTELERRALVALQKAFNRKLLISDDYLIASGLVLPKQTDDIPRHLFFNIGR